MSFVSPLPSYLSSSHPSFILFHLFILSSLHSFPLSSSHPSFVISFLIFFPTYRHLILLSSRFISSFFHLSFFHLHSFIFILTSLHSFHLSSSHPSFFNSFLLFFPTYRHLILLSSFSPSFMAPFVSLPSPFQNFIIFFFILLLDR